MLDALLCASTCMRYIVEAHSSASPQRKHLAETQKFSHRLKDYPDLKIIIIL